MSSSKTCSVRYCLMLTLPSLWLIGVLVGASQAGEVGVLTGGLFPALAADGHHGQVKCTQEYHGPFFGKSVVVTSGEVICSNLTSFGGTVVIGGEVTGDVVSFGSNVTINGKIDGNITLYGGTIALQPSAHFSGDIHLCGDQWVPSAIEPHITRFDCSEHVSRFLVDDGGLTFHVWFVLIWIVFGILLASLLPEHLMLVRTTVISKTRRSLVLGLLSTLLAPAVILILVALIISIPLAIIVIAGLISAWVLGTVAVAWTIGDSILRAVAPHQNTRALQVVVGLTLLGLASFLPYNIGWLFVIGAGLPGLGAVLLSRFGTRLYIQPKQLLMQHMPLLDHDRDHVVSKQR